MDYRFGSVRSVNFGVIPLTVTQNPYQSPNQPMQESAESEHQSFRMTRGSTTPDASVVIGSFRDAARFSLLLQVPLLLITSMVMDGGMIFKRFAIASAAFWILILIMRIRRGSKMPDSDILLVKWGYLPVLLVTCIMWIIASLAMNAWS